MLESYRSLVLLQLLPLLAVLLIYLRSTSLDGLEPQNSSEDIPPADRLVVFVRDDLSAQTFFANRCNNIPLLRNIFLHEGLVGVSCPEAPSYRPLSPYVALFSGVNEEAATVIRNWLWQSKATDSVFKRSHHNFAWTTAELGSYFPAMNLHRIMEIQPEDLVAESVLNFLSVDSHLLQKTKGIIFFVHLTGVEPSQKSLPKIEANIMDMYKRFEEKFPDKRTAYLLTSNLGKPKLLCRCNLAVESPFMLWGAGVAHTTTLGDRSIMVNATGHKLPLHVLNPLQLTPLMSALLGLPPPIYSSGMLPRGLLNVSLAYEAKAMLTNAQQLLAQARHLRGLHPSTTSSFWLDFQLMDSFVRNCRRLMGQERFKALREYSCNYMPLLIKEIDFYKDYFRGIMVWAVTVAGIGWLWCTHHLSHVQGQEVAPIRGLVWARGVSRLLTGLLVIFMMLEKIPFVVQAILLLPSLYWTITLKIITLKTELVSLRCGILSAILAMTCLGGFNRRYIMALGYLVFTCYSNRDAFRVRGMQLYLWLLLVLGLFFLSFLPETLGRLQPGAQLVSICLTLMRPLAFGVFLSPVTWLVNIAILLAYAEYILVGWLPWVTYAASWVYLGYVAYGQRRRLQPSELMFFNLSTLYTLTCTSYESVVIQMLAMELQLGLRMKLERNETIGPKTASHYILVYSWYSLFVIGSVPALGNYFDILHETTFGHFTLSYFLIMTLKLLVPWLLMLCILAGTYKDVWSHERKIFLRLLLLNSAMSLVLLHQVRNDGPWRNILSRFAKFAMVQVFPVVWLLLWRLANHKLGSKWISQLPERVA
ncbi:GPI ethanolamine phosphate transferase 1 [Drosophila kikkawai]|uniref:GPI ethanolamine phosphate transferase 1 n=1 Tax=Drosophila kikkawai TaxID=30033 RepID=A0A6P4I7Q6_DROKI|nr:GPI ethanolamine phosphate transferase 1 isoform X1 [Drosophila kikkawai]